MTLRKSAPPPIQKKILQLICTFDDTATVRLFRWNFTPQPLLENIVPHLPNFKGTRNRLIAVKSAIRETFALPLRFNADFDDYLSAFHIKPANVSSLNDSAILGQWYRKASATTIASSVETKLSSLHALANGTPPFFCFHSFSAFREHLSRAVDKESLPKPPKVVCTLPS